MDLLGFDPSTIGFESAAESALADPTDVTAGLFRAMEPFEQELTERSVTEQGGQFGQLGGRFSRNAVDADTRLRGRLGAEFARSREQALIQAAAQRNQALTSLLNAVSGAQQVGNQRMASYLNFLSPGAPNYQQGVLQDLIGAGGNIAASALLGPAGPAVAALSGIGTGGIPLPQPNFPSSLWG